MKKRLQLVCTLMLSATMFLTACQTPDKPEEARTAESTVEETTVSETTSAAEQTIEDSTGRSVTFAAAPTKIAPSGTLAQLMLYTIAPERLVGWSKKPSEGQAKFMPESLKDLPEFGQFYGKNVTLNMEALVAAAPQVIIDLGDMKKSHKEDMTQIQEQTNIPTLFIKATLDNFPEAYRQLGKILGEEKKAEELAAYLEKALSDAAEYQKMAGEKPTRIYFGGGKEGLEAQAKGSVHAVLIEMLGAVNALEVPEVSHKGNPIDREQLLNLNADLILLQGSSPFEEIMANPAWQELRAVKEGKAVSIPSKPYSFIGNPPSVNQVPGIYWLGQLLYPEAKIDAKAKIQEFYKLFYHYDLTDEEYAKLIK